MKRQIDLSDPDEAMNDMLMKLNGEYQFTDDIRGRDYSYDLWTERTLIVPPYDENFESWLDKAIESSSAGACVVAICPARTGDKWFHEKVLGVADDIRFTSYSVPFSAYGGKNKMYMPAIVAIYRPKSHFIVNINAYVMGREIDGQLRVGVLGGDSDFAKYLTDHIASVPRDRLARNFAEFLIRK